MAKCKAWGRAAASIMVGGAKVTRQMIRNIGNGVTGYNARQRAAVRRVGGMEGFNRRVKAGQTTMR